MPETEPQSNKSHDQSHSGFKDAVALIKALIETRGFRKERLDEPAVVAVINILAEAAQHGDAISRLDAVSVLGKAAEISKPVAAFVRPFLDAALRRELPPTADWGNADDRYYLAKAVTISEAPWIKAYAASEMATGELSEKASRAVWADIAITRAASLAEALDAIFAALSVSSRR